MRQKLPSHRPRGGATDLAAAESSPRAVAALADGFVAGAVIPAHQHERAQLIYAVKGSMTVRSGTALWLLPSSHALWIPDAVVHEVTMNTAVQMRTLYVKAVRARRIGRTPRVIFVSPLLRELIARAMDIPALYEERGPDGRVMQMILDEIARLPARPLELRMPTDSRLLRACGLVLRALAEPPSMPKLCDTVGLSERTLMRIFPLETGLTFGQWLAQAKLLKAFELFDQGHNVTRVALELGYATPGAFAKMFRRVTGQAPGPALRAGLNEEPLKPASAPAPTSK